MYICVYIYTYIYIYICMYIYEKETVISNNNFMIMLHPRFNLSWIV